MHCAVVEFARNVANLEGANSTEFLPENKHPIISLMNDQQVNGNKGGTMRLGDYPCQLRKDSFAFKAYGLREIKERHRHRYEFNNKYRFQLEEAGLCISGISPSGNLVEIVEISDHPGTWQGNSILNSSLLPENLTPYFGSSSLTPRSSTAHISLDPEEHSPQYPR